jgi:protein-tyrosine kinase
MGKIFDALERYKKEKSIETDGLFIGGPEKLIEDVTKSPPDLQSTVHSHVEKAFEVSSAPGFSGSENFKILRNKLLYPKDGHKRRTILVTSAFEGEGKTFVAANLGVSIARGVDEYALLVDCDFHHPNLHSRLGYSNNEGLYEYLVGKRQLSDVIIRTKVEKLSLLPAGNFDANASDLLSSPLMKKLLGLVKGRNENRFIIIDGPPSELLTETTALANFVEGIIFVVRAQKSPREEIRKSIKNLGKKKILGIVFNGYYQM